MHNRRRHCRRLLYRGAGLVLLTPLLLGSGLISGGGGGGGGTPGTGDIEQVFSCTTGPCTNITVDTGQSLGTTGSGSIAATTAAALAANPTDCTVGQFANAIAANGDLTCSAASVSLADADDDATTKGVVTFLNSEFDCVAGLCNIAAGGVTDGDLASNYSGVGACAANTWASTLNDNAAPTCTQPAFSNISGSVTDAQVPNTITVDLATAATALAANPTDCTTNQFATAIVANGNLTCAQPTIGDLVAFSSSQLATALTDETGTAGSAVFSAAPTFTGSVKVAGDGANLTFDPDATGLQSFVTFTDGTETISNVWLLANVASGTYTLNNASSAVSGFSLSTAVILDMTTAPSFAQNFFNQAAQYRMSVAGTTPLIRPFVAQSTYNANNVAWTMSNDSADYTSIPTFSITGGGTFVSAARMGFYGKATVSGGTVTQYRGFVFDDATGAGAVTTQVGVDIAALSKATTNIGLRNADTTVYTPATQAIAAAANTVTCSATVVNLTTVAGTTTFTSNPTVADGTAGQVCTLMNTDATATDCLVFTDATLGLQLAGNFTMCPNDTLTLEYNGTDWIELSRSDADNSEPRTACVALDNVTTAVLRRYWIAPAGGASITAVSCVYGDLDGSAACTSAPTVEWEDQAANVVTSSGITCTSTTGTWTATTGALTTGEVLTLDVVTAADTDCDIVACAQYSF